MQVPLEEIMICDRVRQDIGDLKPLMKSLQEHGQLNAVTLTRSYELIAGHRRVLAARELKWRSIEANVVDRSSEVEKLQLELEENVHRKDFSPEELLAGYRRLDKLLHPSVAKRVTTAVRCFFSRLFGRKKRSEQSPDMQPAPLPDTPKTGKAPAPPSPSKEEPEVIGSQFGVCSDTGAYTLLILSCKGRLPKEIHTI